MAKDKNEQQKNRMELMRSAVRSFTAVEVEKQILDFEDSLNIKDGRGNKAAPLQTSFQLFFHADDLDTNGYPKNNVDMEDVRHQKKRFANFLTALYHRAEELNIRTKASTDINSDEMTLNRRLIRITKMVESAYQMVLSQVQIYESVTNSDLVQKVIPEDAVYRGNPIDLDDAENTNSPYQNLLLYLLNQAYADNLCRYADNCCEQIKTPDGYFTKAWKPVMEIKDFVYAVTQKEDNYEMWRNLTSKGSIVADVIRHLSNCKDFQFPEIKKNRNVWSFRNGIFNGRVEAEDGSVSTKFYTYRSEEFKTLEPTMVSSKYFDQEFDHYDDLNDWYDIPTPHMQSVMDYQRFPEDVSRWLYIFCGRLCYEVNDLDSWQVIPFLKGIARSGKSTIITKVCKKFYEGQDVKTLSNNIERKFGLESIHQGFMFISPEVKGDLALEQAEFQSLVSGEDMSIARKCKSAVSLTWNVPGILAGNEVPNWKDNSGSVLRRLLTWNFGRQVMEADPKLDDKLEIEIPAILCKCVKAYLEASRKYNAQDIWNVVPQYFKTVQTQVAMITNTLQHFLASEKVRYGKDLCCPQKLFVHVFNQHCQENNLGKPKFNPDFYAGPFSSREIEVRTETRMYKEKSYAAQPFIFGMDIVQETLDFNDNY